MGVSMGKTVLGFAVILALFQPKKGTPAEVPTAFFEQNVGQFTTGEFYLLGKEHQLVIHENGFDVFFSEASLLRTQKTPLQPLTLEQPIQFRFVNAGRGKAIGENPLGFPTSYILSANPHEWIHNVQSYNRVRLTGLYPGIDAVFYIRNGHLAYDLILAKGADPSQVGLEVIGASRLWSDKGGLHVVTSKGELVHTPPKSWRVGPQGPIPLEVSYKVEGNRVCFSADQWPTDQEAVIDPEVFSVTWGLEATDAVLGPGDRLFVLMDPASPGRTQVVLESDAITGKIQRRMVFPLDVWPYMTRIAVTQSGLIALATTCTNCSNLPLRHPLQAKPGGGRDVYFAAFTPQVDDFVLATFLGKDLDEDLVDLAASPDNQFLVALHSQSPGLPTTAGVFRPDCERFRPLNTCVDNYIALLDPVGGRLTKATYVWQEPTQFEFLADGSLVIAGSSSSPNLPLVRAVDNKPEGREAFLYRLSADFQYLHFATYLGGEDRDYAYALHISRSQTIWIGGETNSTRFPLKNPFRSQILGASEGFVAAFSPEGDLLFSSLVGGEGADAVQYLCDGNDGRFWLFLSSEKPIPLLRPLRAYPRQSYDRLLEISPDLGVLSVSATPVLNEHGYYLFGTGGTLGRRLFFPTSDGGWTMLTRSAHWHVRPGEQESDLRLSVQQTSRGPVASITNHGPNPASGVMLFSTSFYRVRDYCPDCYIGTLLPGQTKYWLFTRYFPEDVYSVSSNLPDPNPADNVTTPAPTQALSADLEVTLEKQETPSERIVVAHIKNLGPSPAPVPVVSWGWYPEFGPPEMSASGEPSCWQHQRACVWGSLAPGQEQTVTLRFGPVFQNPTHLSFYVAHGADDPNPANNEALATLEARTMGFRFQYVVPVVAHNPGANNTLWRTDLWCVNLASSRANLELTYHSNDGMEARASLAIEAKRLHAAPNLLETVFSVPPNANTAGSLWILADQPLALASRTYNATPSGTFGQGIPVLTPGDFWQTGRSLVPELARNFRTNAGCFSRRWESVRAKLSSPFDVRGIYGCPHVPQMLSVSPRSFRLLPDVFRTCQGETLLLAQIESLEPQFDELDAQSNEWCFASWVDPQSGDPTFVPPLAGTGEVLPVVIHAPGLHGSFWRTDVILPGTIPGAPTTRRLVFMGKDETRERTITITGDVTAVLRDVLVSVFGYPSDASVSGVLLLADPYTSSWAMARVYTESAQGSYGQEFTVLPSRMGSGVGFGERGVLPVLVQDQNFRTNLGLVNVSSDGLEARVRIFNSSGQEVGSRLFRLGPWQREQVNEVLSPLGETSGYAVVETLTPETYVWAYASMVDNRTNDPTTLPMWRERP